MDDEHEKPKKSWSSILQEQIDRKNAELAFEVRMPIIVYDPGWLNISPSIPDEDIKNAIVELQNIQKAREIIEEHERLHAEAALMSRPKSMSNSLGTTPMSDAHRRFAFENRLNFVDVKLSKLEAEDFIGIPNPNLAKDYAINTAVLEYLELPIPPLFMDEMSLCSPSTQPSRRVKVPVRDDFAWNNNGKGRCQCGCGATAPYCSSSLRDASGYDDAGLPPTLHTAVTPVCTNEQCGKTAAAHLPGGYCFISRSDERFCPPKEVQVSTTRVEAPCKQCSRNNDIGSKKCWWCETPEPVC